MDPARGLVFEFAADADFECLAQALGVVLKNGNTRQSEGFGEESPLVQGLDDRDELVVEIRHRSPMTAREDATLA